jgi:hypothetical protein
MVVAGAPAEALGVVTALAMSVAACALLLVSGGGARLAASYRTRRAREIGRRASGSERQRVAAELQHSDDPDTRAIAAELSCVLRQDSEVSPAVHSPA